MLQSPIINCQPEFLLPWEKDIELKSSFVNSLLTKFEIKYQIFKESHWPYYLRIILFQKMLFQKMKYAAFGK